MAKKTSADLLIDINNDITTATAPDSITPGVDGARRADTVDSTWNKKDGILVGSPDRPAITIPGAFTSLLNDGDPLETFIQVMLDRIDALQVAVTGAIQGLIGEFLAIITAETNQTILIDENGTSGAPFISLGKIKFANDCANGGFDNGNNWLLDRFVIPSSYGAGKTNVKFQVSNLKVNLLENNVALSGSRLFKFVLTKNGTQIGSVESTTATIANGDPTGIIYFDDFSTGNIALNTLSAGDVIALELYEHRANSSIADIRIQTINGFINNELS
jgi:hypothetical protein